MINWSKFILRKPAPKNLEMPKSTMDTLSERTSTRRKSKARNQDKLLIEMDSTMLLPPRAKRSRRSTEKTIILLKGPRPEINTNFDRRYRMKRM